MSGLSSSRDVVLDLAVGRENHGDPEPPDKTSTGVLKLTGGGDRHEDVLLGDAGSHDDLSHGDQEDFGDDDGQGSPRPSH